MPRLKNHIKSAHLKDEIIETSVSICNHPYNVCLLLFRGILYEADNQFENAIADFDKVLEISPNNIDALYLKADYELEHGSCFDASTTLDKILLLEQFDIDEINTNLLFFFRFLLKKRKTNIIQKITSTIHFAKLNKALNFPQLISWN